MFYEILLDSFNKSEKNFNFVKLSFAAPLYSILDYAKETFGFTYIEKDRKFLQYIGAWVREQANESNGILTVMHDKIKSIEKEAKYDGIIIDDLRMKTEIEFLKELKFDCIRLTGRRHDEANMSGGSILHKTEIDLDDYDMTQIENNESVEFIANEIFNK